MIKCSKCGSRVKVSRYPTIKVPYTQRWCTNCYRITRINLDGKLEEINPGKEEKQNGHENEKKENQFAGRSSDEYKIGY